MKSDQNPQSNGSRRRFHNKYWQPLATQLPQLLQTAAYVAVIILPLLIIALLLTVPETLFELATLAVLLVVNIVTLIIEQLIRKS